LRVWTSRSPLNTAPLPALHPACRRRCAQEATPRHERLPNVPLRSLDAGRLVIARGGFLRCASSAADLTPFGLRSRPHRAARAAPALGPRLDVAGSPALRQPALGRVRLRVSTGAGLCCPPPQGCGSSLHPRSFPGSEHVALSVSRVETKWPTRRPWCCLRTRERLPRPQGTRRLLRLSG
jgi:hypothetical protein